VNRASSRASCAKAFTSLWVTSIVLGALAGSAQSAPDKRAREAAQLYQDGKYQQAAELYTKLRDEKQNPKFLCNLALCYLKMGYLDPGIETIRQCLGAAALSPDIRSGYESLLTRLEAQRAAAGQPQEVVVPPPVDVNLVPVPEAGVPYPGTGQDPAAAALLATPAVAAAGVAGAPAWGAPAYDPNAPAAAAAVGPGAYPPAGPGLAQAAPYDPANPAGYPSGYPAGPAGYATPMPAGAAPPPDAGPRGKRRLPFGTYVTGAVGVVGTAMGIALVLHGQAVQQELDSSQGNPADTEQLESDLSRTKNGSTVAFIVGGVGLGAAVVWALVAPSYTKPELAAGGVTVAVGPRSLGLAGRF
jgi:hypothetical protein